MLTDLGAGEYTKEYFHDGRYRILCNNSFGHSVPVIDGEGQKEGGGIFCNGRAKRTRQGRNHHFLCRRLWCR